MKLLTFKLDQWRCAVPISIVEKVLQAVAITPLPQMPDILLGIIDVHGTVIPVVNIRYRFQLQQNKRLLSEQLVIVETIKRRLAFLVDGMTDIIDCPETEIVPSNDLISGLNQVEGVVKTTLGMILVYDFERFLSLEEEMLLNCTLQKSESADEAGFGH